MYSEKMKEAKAFLISAKERGILEGKTENMTQEDMLWLRPADVESGVTFTVTALNGVEVELLEPEEMKGNGVIFYIHGGSFSYGDIHTSRPFASTLAVESGLRVYSISYRLAPQHQFPAGADDCFAVYKALVELYSGENIAIVGDSAGANLSLVTALMAKDQGVILPSSITLYSVASDFASGLDSRIRNKAVDILATDDVDKEIGESYFKDSDASNPYISPLFGDYNGFCPLKIIVDVDEALFDDSDLLAKKAEKSGVEVDYQVWENTFHAFPSYPTVASKTPESDQVVKETIEFIKKHLNP